jgi:hypothetical protein
MRLWLLSPVWLVCGFVVAAQDTPKPYVRFFNDSAKAADFYVDGQFGCSVPANPEKNNAYCDADSSSGKHTLSVKGPKLSSQSCETCSSHFECNGDFATIDDTCRTVAFWLA